MYSNFFKTILQKFYIGPLEILFSIIFTIVFVSGHILSSYKTIDVNSLGARAIISYFCGSLIIWGATLFSLVYIKKRSLRKSINPKGIFLKNLSDRKLWLLTTGIIFASYLPIILLSHSVLSPDSWNSIRQITGDQPLANTHPIIFTEFAGIFIRIGLLFKSLELGLVLFSLAQSVILAMIFAEVVVWMRRARIGTGSIVATLLFYAVLPVNSIAGIILWKDILFAGFGLMLLVTVRQLYVEKDKFFNKRNISLFIALAFVFCAWRNNGFYAYLVFVILALTINRETFFNKRHLLLLFSPLILFIMYSTISSLVAKPTTLAEAMSVPLQQIARTVKYHNDTISTKEKGTIEQILPYNQLSEKYNPALSDPVKGSFDVSAFKRDESKYAELWLKLFAEHPKSYVAAFLYNTYGYTYPFYPSSTTTDIISDNDIHFNAIKGYSDETYNNGGKIMITKYRDLIMSVVPFFQNIGFYFCIIMLGLYIAIIRRLKELVGVFIILFGVFLTTILGPVNGEFRYLYLFVVATPFVIGSIFSHSIREEKKNRA
jgi:hypothetical protein